MEVRTADEDEVMIVLGEKHSSLQACGGLRPLEFHNLFEDCDFNRSK